MSLCECQSCMSVLEDECLGNTPPPPFGLREGRAGHKNFLISVERQCGRPAVRWLSKMCFPSASSLQCRRRSGLLTHQIRPSPPYFRPNVSMRRLPAVLHPAAGAPTEAAPRPVCPAKQHHSHHTEHTYSSPDCQHSRCRCCIKTINSHSAAGAAAAS